MRKCYVCTWHIVGTFPNNQSTKETQSEGGRRYGLSSVLGVGWGG